MPTVAVVSFRLGLTDGVSIVSEQWCRALRTKGWTVRTVAGEGPVDVTVPGLAIDATAPPSPAELEAALIGADLVVVPNLLSLPLNLEAGERLAAVLRGRTIVLHHHDPAWQRERFSSIDWPLDDPAWVHVVINELTRRQFLERGRTARLIRNSFDDPLVPGDRAGTRAALGLADGERLALHPVRAIARKEIATALEICERIGATYWLPGPAEEDYDDELERLLAATTAPVDRRPLGTIEDRYAACDLVVFPSSWEGFGNPPVEASVRRRPAVVGPYPVADELIELGFAWHRSTDLDGLPTFLDRVDDTFLDDQRALALDRLGPERLTADLDRLLADLVYPPVTDSSLAD